MKVVAQRVDALTVAYRVALHPGFVERLKERAKVAREHGRASCHWRGFSGELRFSRASNVWNITNTGWRARIDVHAPGKVERDDVGAIEAERIRIRRSPKHVFPEVVDAAVKKLVGDVETKRVEPGWTVEIVWAAQTLAVSEFGWVIQESRRLAEKMGEVFECRLRRLDLCADVAGWVIRKDDADNLLLRSRCKVRTDADRDCGKASCRRCSRCSGRWGAAAATMHAVRRLVTGLTVGKDAMMARNYAKDVELKHAPQEKREAEHARWRAGGWDGVAPVARVEFQLRGHVLREFGIRDPEQTFDAKTREALGGLDVVLDRVWKACLGWMRLVKPEKTASGKDLAMSRCEDDERWKLLRTVSFHANALGGTATRRARKGTCATTQITGSMLSVLAARGVLPRFTLGQEKEEAWAGDGTEGVALTALWQSVTALGLHSSDAIVSDMLERWLTPEKAMAHLAVAVRAACARQRTGIREQEPDRGRWRADGLDANVFELFPRKKIPWGTGGAVAFDRFVSEGRATLARCSGPPMPAGVAAAE